MRLRREQRRRTRRERQSRAEQARTRRDQRVHPAHQPADASHPGLHSTAGKQGRGHSMPPKQRQDRPGQSGEESI
eukprot:7663164-Alexandrium_andersonii.AAC.1